MLNFILVLIFIECVLLTTILLRVSNKIHLPTRLLEVVIIIAIILAIVINTLIVINRS